MIRNRNERRCALVAMAAGGALALLGLGAAAYADTKCCGPSGCEMDTSSNCTGGYCAALNIPCTVALGNANQITYQKGQGLSICNSATSGSCSNGAGKSVCSIQYTCSCSKNAPATCAAGGDSPSSQYQYECGLGNDCPQ